MNLFSRISATLSATAETAVSKFENHDAIAESALVEARQAFAKARIRHRSMEQSVTEIRANLASSELQIEKWTERARALADTNESRTLQCLEQRRHCREQAESHRVNLVKHEELCANMAGRLKQMEVRLQELTNQRNEMRSRESLARATQVMDKIDSRSSDGVDAVFERWELNISDTEVRNEIRQDDQHTMPSLEREFDEQERQAELREELAALTAKDTENSND